MRNGSVLKQTNIHISKKKKNGHCPGQQLNIVGNSFQKYYPNSLEQWNMVWKIK